MRSDEDLDGAVEETIRVEQLTSIFWRKIWDSVGMLGVTNWDRPPPTPVAGRVEAAGHCSCYARVGAVDRVVCAGSSLVE
jgi:hypothetical protein